VLWLTWAETCVHLLFSGYHFIFTNLFHNKKICSSNLFLLVFAASQQLQLEHLGSLQFKNVIPPQVYMYPLRILCFGLIYLSNSLQISLTIPKEHISWCSHGLPFLAAKANVCYNIRLLYLSTTWCFTSSKCIWSPLWRLHPDKFLLLLQCMDMKLSSIKHIRHFFTMSYLLVSDSTFLVEAFGLLRNIWDKTSFFLLMYLSTDVEWIIGHPF
jgi:hypothetical protein